MGNGCGRLTAALSVDFRHKEESDPSRSSQSCNIPPQKRRRGPHCNTPLASRELTIHQNRATDIRKTIVVAIIVGGWVWFVIHLAQQIDSQDDLTAFMLLVAIGATVAAIVRLIKYGPVLCENFCMGQRLASKQWIVRRHDRILLAPLLIVVVGWFLPWLLHNAVGASIAVACGLTVGVVILISQGMGPNLRDLQYTGVHSKSGGLQTQSKEFITTGSRS